MSLPILVVALPVVVFAAQALEQGRPVKFSFSLVHGVHFEAQGPRPTSD